MTRSLRPERLCQELEDVAVKMFDEVRRDTGGFSTGACVINGKSLLMVNNRQPIDERIAALAREIARHNPTRLYLKPAIREEVERWANKAELSERAQEEV
jgi:hypothetical protein